MLLRFWELALGIWSKSSCGKKRMRFLVTYVYKFGESNHFMRIIYFQCPVLHGSVFYRYMKCRMDESHCLTYKVSEISYRKCRECCTECYTMYSKINQ